MIPHAQNRGYDAIGTALDIAAHLIHHGGCATGAHITIHPTGVASYDLVGALRAASGCIKMTHTALAAYSTTLTEVLEFHLAGLLAHGGFGALDGGPSETLAAWVDGLDPAQRTKTVLDLLYVARVLASACADLNVILGAKDTVQAVAA